MLLFYIKMFLIKIFLKHSSAKYYQKSKEKLQKKTSERYQGSYKKEKNKKQQCSQKMV